MCSFEILRFTKKLELLHTKTGKILKLLNNTDRSKAVGIDILSGKTNNRYLVYFDISTEFFKGIYNAKSKIPYQNRTKSRCT